MPVEVENRLATTLADIDNDAVVLQTLVTGGVADELEHALRLVCREFGDLPERRHVPLRDHEQVRVGPWIDVTDGHEPVGLRDVIAFPVERAEEAVVRQRGSPPPSRPRRTPARAR